MRLFFPHLRLIRYLTGSSRMARQKLPGLFTPETDVRFITHLLSVIGERYEKAIIKSPRSGRFCRMTSFWDGPDAPPRPVSVQRAPPSCRNSSAGRIPGGFTSGLVGSAARYRRRLALETVPRRSRFLSHRTACLHCFGWSGKRLILILNSRGLRYMTSQREHILSLKLHLFRPNGFNKVALART